jgi:hypothetical protein
MPTLTSTQSATLTLGAFESITVIVGRVGKASMSLTSLVPNGHPDMTITDVVSKTYGPYGVPMTCVIACSDGSVQYTQNRSQVDPVWSDSTGTALVDPQGRTVMPDPLKGPLTVNSRDGMGRATSYTTADAVTYTVVYGSFGPTSISGGGRVRTVAYSASGQVTGITEA